MLLISLSTYTFVYIPPPDNSRHHNGHGVPASWRYLWVLSGLLALRRPHTGHLRWPAARLLPSHSQVSQFAQLGLCWQYGWFDRSTAKELRTCEQWTQWVSPRPKTKTNTKNKTTNCNNKICPICTCTLKTTTTTTQYIPTKDPACSKDLLITVWGMHSASVIFEVLMPLQMVKWSS